MGPQPQGINEGTADFVALLYLVDNSAHLQSYSGTYAVGGWAIGRVVPDGEYYGFRRYPYSTDLARNPLMFRHLSASATLPPEVPNGGPFDDPVEEHAVGEVWAVTLWDAYVGMLTSGRYTHAGARDRMREYLVAALKLMPDAPTFLEARDVFYAVVLSRSREDHAEFTAAFAKRGMGRARWGRWFSPLPTTASSRAFSWNRRRRPRHPRRHHRKRRRWRVGCAGDVAAGDAGRAQSSRRGSAQAVRRATASRYFSAVRAQTSAGIAGPGACLFQARVSR